MCGRRGWAYAGFAQLRRQRVLSCSRRSQGRDPNAMAHVDDVLCSGAGGALMWLQGEFALGVPCRFGLFCKDLGRSNGIPSLGRCEHLPASLATFAKTSQTRPGLSSCRGIRSCGRRVTVMREEVCQPGSRHLVVQFSGEPLADSSEQDSAVDWSFFCQGRVPRACPNQSVLESWLANSLLGKMPPCRSTRSEL